MIPTLEFGLLACLINDGQCVCGLSIKKLHKWSQVWMNAGLQPWVNYAKCPKAEVQNKIHLWKGHEIVPHLLDGCSDCGAPVDREASWVEAMGADTALVCVTDFTQSCHQDRKKSEPSALRESPLSSQLYVWCDLLPFMELPYSNLKYGFFCVLVWRWRALEMSCILFPTKKAHFIDWDRLRSKRTLTLTLGVNYIGLRLEIWGTKTAENLSGSYGGRPNVWHRNRWPGITSICPRTSKLQTIRWNGTSARN